MSFKFNPITNRLDITGTSGGGGGDVNGPGSSTDNAIVRWDGVSGTLIQNSVAILSDAGDLLLNSIDLTIPVDETDGGTGITSYTSGDILYATGASTLAKLPIGSVGEVLTVSGGLPSWAAATGGVTSVSGTANRITSTGGATPVIDIAATYVGQTSITTLGTITSGTWNGSVVGLAYGGTAANLTASNGGIFYSTAAAGAILAGTATANKVLMSGSSTTPSWSTPTFPNASATSGKFIQSDGTNWLASTPTFPTTAGASGKILRSDGTNYVESTPTYPNSATSTGTILRADGTNWVASTATYPDTVAAGDLRYGSSSNVNGNLSISTYYGVQLLPSNSGLPAWGSPRNYIFLTDEFVGTTSASSLGWVSSSSGSGNAVNGGSTTVGNSSANIGVFGLTTANTGNVNFSLGSNGGGFACFTLGGGFISMVFYAKLSNLSDGTDTYNVVIGFADNPTIASIANGLYFAYTNGTNSGNWQVISKAASSTTTGNSSTAADTSWHRFKIEVNAGATSVSFFIDDVEIAGSPLTTNIPSAIIRPQMSVNRSAGTATRNFSVDYFTYFQNLTSAR